MNIKELAKRLDVSYSTVSKSLNNDPKVAEKTRKRVLAEAEKLGFILDPNARGLAGKKTKRIGILVSNQFNTKEYRWFFSQIQTFATRAIEEKGYDFYIQPHTNIRGESNIIRMVNGKTVDGIMIFTRDVTQREYDLLAEKQFPHVFCYYNPVFLEKNHPNLFMDDDEYGGYIVTKYLIENNHRDILAVKSDDPAMKMYTQRTHGYIRAMREHNLVPTITEIPMNFTAARNLVRERFSFLKNFTAFFVEQDQAALSMINEFQRMHQLNIPEDYSIIGYNNMDLIDDLDIPLTSVADPMKKVIRNAASSLIKMVEGEADDEIRLFYPKIISRNSVKKLTIPALPKNI